MGRELGRFLEHRRRELGLSRRDLAEQSGLSYPYVSQLETGDREPALKTMRALAPVLDVRPEELAALQSARGSRITSLPSSSRSASSRRTSRSILTASRIIVRASSRVRPCEWAPGISGTETTHQPSSVCS